MLEGEWRGSSCGCGRVNGGGIDCGLRSVNGGEAQVDMEW